MPMKNGEMIAAIAVAPYAQPDLRVGEMQRLAEVRPHRDEPGAPDEVLQEHHRGQTRANRRHECTGMKKVMVLE